MSQVRMMPAIEERTAVRTHEDVSWRSQDEDARSGLIRCLGPLGDVWLRAQSAFGGPFARYLVVLYVGLKGFNLALLTGCMLPVFKGLGMSSDAFQLATVVASTPWSMIGWIGVLSDLFPIGRYHIRGYLLGSSALGMIGYVGLIALPVAFPSSSASSTASVAWLAVLCFFLANVMCATFDTLTEGKCAAMMRQRGSGQDVMSLVWSCASLGGLASGIALAFLDQVGPWLLLVFMLPPALICTVLAANGSVPEKRAARGIRREKLRSEPRLFLLAFTMAFGALVMASTAFLATSLTRLIVSLGAALSLVVVSFWALPRILARATLYLFIASSAYVNISGSLSYFYTGDASCVPDGPGFSMGYYVAITSIIGSGGAVVGSLLFNRYRGFTFRGAFGLATIVQIAAALFDLVIIFRLNRSLGIPDWAMYLFGDAACQQIATMLAVMPGVLLISRLCPRGAEATVYAILAGFNNFGQNVSAVLGVWLTDALGVKGAADAAGSGCDFTNLGLAVVLAHCVLPLAGLPLLFCLVPDAQLSDDNAFTCASPPPSFASAWSPAASQFSSPTRSPRTPLIDADHLATTVEGDPTFCMDGLDAQVDSDSSS
eukprot:TRINITY_DN23743_c0_g1_i1.p1 TRINITY_DN23743_c0_g1~~TRINITY_DN23743_c0_g1_i1.p1  ORF type:complete len:602 (-),score=62.37 TRINITY_DN23743_c0_g1_i1:101-1906(-)